MRKIRQSLPPCCGERGATKFPLLEGSGRDKSCSVTAHKVNGTKWAWSSTEMSTDPLSSPETGEFRLRPMQILPLGGQNKVKKKITKVQQYSSKQYQLNTILLDPHWKSHTHTHTHFVSLSLSVRKIGRGRIKTKLRMVSSSLQDYTWPSMC